MRVTVPLIVDQSLRRGDVEAALRFASSQRDEHLWRWLVEQRELPEDTLRRLLPAACLGGDVRSLWPCLRGLLAAGRHALVVATCLLLAQDDASRLKGNPELALVAVLTAAKRSRDCLRLCAPLLEAAPELAKSCLAAHPGADVAPRLLQHLPAAEHPKLLLGALLHLFENRAFAASEPLLLLYGSLCTKDRPQRLFDLLRRLDDIDAGAKTPLWDHLAARVRSGDTGHRRLLGSGEPCVSLGDGRAAVSPVDIRSVTAESFSKSAKRYWKIATDLDGFQKRLAAMGKPVEVYKTETVENQYLASIPPDATGDVALVFGDGRSFTYSVSELVPAHPTVFGLICYAWAVWDGDDSDMSNHVSNEELEIFKAMQQLPACIAYREED